MSSRECQRIAQFVDWAHSFGLSTDGEHELLKAWLAKADAVLPSVPAVEPREPVKLPGTGKRGKTRGQKRYEAQVAKQDAAVQQLFGPRPLLPHEVEKLREYEPVDS